MADWQQFLEESAACAESGMARFINRLYVADGLMTEHAAHAKIILLANGEVGRLLVGSGNLNMDGYASGGEVFIRYEYSSKVREHLAAFASVRELLEGTLERRYVGATAAKRIRYLLEQTPWLYQAAHGMWNPVRHNLQQSFLEQLRQAVGGKRVEELWIAAPFYDKEAIALQHLITTFDPKQLTLLVQPGRTSVEPASLKRVLGQFRGRGLVRPFATAPDTPYVHAKIYLIKMADQALCLQGSPNMSVSAMLTADPVGNLEVANLLMGPRNTFDYLLERWDVGIPVQDLMELSLSYHDAPDDQPPTPTPSWRLTSGEWSGTTLSLHFKGILPNLKGARLIVGTRPFPLDVVRREPSTIQVQLTSEIADSLSQVPPWPTSVCWTEGGQDQVTNPVYSCNTDALDAALRDGGYTNTIERIGRLDLNDQELETLLSELDAALVVDQQSIWQIVGRTRPETPAPGGEEDSATVIHYSDVDYEALRRHPRIQQYIQGRGRYSGMAPTRLQIILNAITDHFRDLRQPVASTVLGGRHMPRVQNQPESEEEAEQEGSQEEQEHLTIAQRSRRVLKNFVRRYLSGLSSADFIHLVGFEVVVTNYAIFSHILWHLTAKSWVEPEFALESFLRMWRFFWGDAAQQGYLDGLNKVQRRSAADIIRANHADAYLLASAWYAAGVTQDEERHNERSAVRDQLRSLIPNPSFRVTQETLEETWLVVGFFFPYDARSTRQIIRELSKLLQFNTQDEILKSLKVLLTGNTLIRSCQFQRVLVNREYLGREMDVKCLMVQSGTALSTLEAATEVLHAWMQFERLDYYRIQSSAGTPRERPTRLVFYDCMTRSGTYWAKDLSENPIDFGELVVNPSAWQCAIMEMEDLATHVDEGLMLPSKQPVAVTPRSATT